MGFRADSEPDEYSFQRQAAHPERCANRNQSIGCCAGSPERQAKEKRQNRETLGKGVLFENPGRYDTRHRQEIWAESENSSECS